MGRLKYIAVLAALSTILFVFAQEAAGPTVTVVDHPEWGPHLADSQGRSLYVYQLDEGGESACTDEVCMDNWPPYIVEGEVTAGDRVDVSLLGTYERPDGSLQVTYNGWPLYYNERDEEQGNIRGQALGDVFYLMAPVGNAVAERPQPQDSPDPAEAEQQGREQAVEGEGDAAEADGEGAAQAEGGAAAGQQDEAMQASLQQGEQLYASSCASCHGAEGQGQVGPALAGNGFVGRTGQFARTVLNGRLEHGMPAFRDQLNDEEIAAIMTFVRNSWGNSFGPVTPEQVASNR